MDNMLYIIAGLVLILLVAGLLLRKNKAQKQSVQPPVNSLRNSATRAPQTDYGTTAQSNEHANNKFDHITIAQRFIDQQRYDKAIETINRGLSEKPNDGQLSIKLLSIYATIDQPENFDNVYNTIKLNNDGKTLTLADELKDLYVGEPRPVATQELATEDAVDNTFDGLDFDLPTSQVNDTDTISDQPVIEDNKDTVIDEPIAQPVLSDELNDTSPTTENAADSFDLTLSDLESDSLESDLESDFDEPHTTADNPVAPLSIADDNASVTSTDESTEVIEDSDFSDFEFDFDSTTDDTSTDNAIISGTLDDQNEELALEDDDFVLDFDDLAADTDTEITNDVTDNLVGTSTDAIQSSEDDFSLSLDSLDTPDNVDTVSNVDTGFDSELSTTEESNDLDSFILENTDFEEVAAEDNTFENSTFEDDSFAELNIEEQLLADDVEGSPVEALDDSSPAPLRFDDNTSIDDDFGIDDADSLLETPASTTAPVELEADNTTEAVESAEDFSSRFAADFDFVKSLDSNQVTLDLAGQYLQLGEYDSAKRLLNEVVAQGNSEQKQQAQVLLERTA
ncbi:FimV/HubP family polar landmark protein [Psychrobacter sp. T6-6]|uniref:FimV/HubP family polar landmark protein n=1 Tax=Psychrobacter sp. T6-6 TaxID=3457452 RepID=UPI003FD02015